MRVAKYCLTNRCTSRLTIASLRCHSGQQSSNAGELERYDALDSKSQTYAAARVELSDLRLPSERIRTA